MWHVIPEMWHLTCDTWLWGDIGPSYFIFWHLKGDTGHLEHDTWQATGELDMWHLTPDTWNVICDNRCHNTWYLTSGRFRRFGWVSCVTCQVSCVTCHLSGVMCQVTFLTCDMPEDLTSRANVALKSGVMYHLLGVTYQVSHVKCHMSCVACQVSCVMC